MHAASALLSWSMELLPFAIRQFARKIVNVYVHFIRILSESPAERSALYTMQIMLLPSGETSRQYRSGVSPP